MAVIEMVPDLISAPDFFGPKEIWALRNLVHAWNSLYGIFLQGPTFLGTKFFGDQKRQGPKW